MFKAAPPKINEGYVQTDWQTIHTTLETERTFSQIIHAVNQARDWTKICESYLPNIFQKKIQFARLNKHSLVLVVGNTSLKMLLRQETPRLLARLQNEHASALGGCQSIEVVTITPPAPLPQGTANRRLSADARQMLQDSAQLNAHHPEIAAVLKQLAAR